MLDRAGGGVAVDQWDDMHLATMFEHQIGTYDLIGRVVTAFDDDVRTEDLHKLVGRVLIEQDDVVNRFDAR